MLETVIFTAERVEPCEVVSECRDPKDDKYLSFAASGQSDCIVSGDVRQLVSMRPRGGISNLSPKDYLALP